MKGIDMKVELDKPWCGWSNLEIDDGKTNFIGALSYIDDVVGIFLSKFNQFLNGENVILTFNEEGTEFSIIMKHYDKLMIISERDKDELHIFDIWSDDIIRPICEEILKNYEDWIKFNIYDNEDSAEFKEEYLVNKKYIDNSIRRISMWCPICDVVELERPLLKELYREIEQIFDKILNEDDINV